ncbi:MAG: AAA domain-containing protein, partial [Bacteroidota bacterium]
QVLTDSSRDGTQEQRHFVDQALNTPEFALLEGPPGSGKTTTIIELVIQLAMRGKRVLLCSATHVAIDNVIGRILGRYADACKDHIVPVRIASQRGDIREEAVKPYRLQTLVRTKKQELKRFFQRQPTLSKSQQYLHDNLESEKDRHLRRLILDSANLVGGTTIGILQHPDLKQGNTNVEPFDYLIVDEASKVPFQEFLVPALHAKRWILVGDIHQLSPYVEDDYVAHSLAKLIPVEEQALVLQASEVKKRLRNQYCYRPVVMFCPENPADYVDLMPEEEVVLDLAPDWKPTPENLLALQAADIILCPEEPRFRKWMTEHLYVKAEFLAAEEQEGVHSLIQQHLHRRRKQGRKQKGGLYHRYTHTWNAENNWAETLAGKLNQYFGRRDAPELADYTEQEINDLIPNPEAKATIQDLSRVVFPSILELLQRGVGKRSAQRREEHFVFQDGMAAASKEDRFSSLSFQHRMHPEIAETSRQYFYQEHNNLQAANSVEEARPDRAWDYRPGHARVAWVAHKDDSWRKQKGIIHPREVADIQRELKRFQEWADRNPVPVAWQRESGTYEVAVLSFYRDQERELRRMLRKLTRQFKRYRNFDLGKRIRLTLCTVDQFQGQEADLVLLTFAKYTKGAHYHSPNRLNVALTRARHQLILFGNQQWMTQKAGLEALNFLGREFPTLKSY